MTDLIHLTPYAPQPDLGTPPPGIGSEAIRLLVDGRSVEVPAGTSVMRAAELAGISVPKLCATDQLDAFGSCRVCLVEIEGRRGTPASCTTLAEEGMEVRTQSEKLQRLRKNVVELYLSDHPKHCETECSLHDLAADMGEGTDVAAEHPELVQELLELARESRVPSPDFPLPALDELGEEHGEAR